MNQRDIRIGICDCQEARENLHGKFEGRTVEIAGERYTIRERHLDRREDENIQLKRYGCHLFLDSHGTRVYADLRVPIQINKNLFYSARSKRSQSADISHFSLEWLGESITKIVASHRKPRNVAAFYKKWQKIQPAAAANTSEGEQHGQTTG